MASTPKIVPSDSTRTYCSAGVLFIALISSSPAMSARRTSPSSTLRMTELTGTHARRSSGVASSAVSLTTPVSRSSPACTMIAPAPVSCARRTASEIGSSSGTAITRLASGRAFSAGSRRRMRALRIEWVAPDHRNHAMTAAHR